MEHRPPGTPIIDPDSALGHLWLALPILGPVVAFALGVYWWLVRRVAGNLIDRFEAVVENLDKTTEQLHRMKTELAIEREALDAIQTDVAALDGRLLNHETRISRIEGVCRVNKRDSA